jgi:hypothetical protein
MLQTGILTGSKRWVGHGAGVSAFAARSGAAHQTLVSSLAALEAMALLASETGMTVHVVLPRAPGAVGRARDAARRAHVDVVADLMASTVRVRFAPAAQPV